MLTDTKINVLEKGLDFAAIQKKMNEPELRSDFNEFCRRMRLKWNFRDESENFSKVSVFNPKSRWQLPQGDSCFEAFLSQVENELFELPEADIKYCNLSWEEWNAITSLADDRNIIVKKADRGSFIIILSRNNYLTEAEKQLSDTKVYQEVSNNENILSKLAEINNKMFSNLEKAGCITEKQLKYLSYEYRKATNIGKSYFLFQSHKRLHNVPGRPIISNWGKTSEKCSEFLDYNFKPSMQKGWLYIIDSSDFIKRTRNLGSIGDNAILVTTDVVGFLS